MQIGPCLLFTHRLISFVAFFIAITSASADELVLANGDLLKGETVSQSATHLLWRSDNFGNLSIPLTNISSINGAEFLPTAAKKVEPAITVASFTNSYKGGLSVTGAYASGNEEREDWDIEGTTTWRTGDYRHDTKINYESHSLDGSAANEEYQLGYGLDFFFREKWFWKNGATWGGNENRAIDQYYSVGSAIGRQLWDTESSALAAESGLTWISEKFNDLSTNDRLTWSWSADYRRILLQSLELFHTHTLLVSVSDVKDSEIRADIGLKAPLVDSLFTELKLEWIYDNQPGLDTKASDSQLTIGVSYSW
ncbi:DUF481 domain-containing protein [SAR92 clade bacterium H921]|jgi:hypothetical protein|nr:DUF481 domain-containing protein [SAR92 clade bacterium H921]MDG0971246.1 DUF481 domain-containing protein [Porticoccaceae bacterium]MDG1306577.1 DUF481 domain-containing protein [Porticoccaceae bacterium]